MQMMMVAIRMRVVIMMKILRLIRRRLIQRVSYKINLIYSSFINLMNFFNVLKLTDSTKKKVLQRQAKRKLNVV